MSKYTKALEKIQSQRSGVDLSPKRAPVSMKVPEAEKITVAKGSYWERGVTELKNAPYDDRVVMMRFPDSMVAEQYRMLRTSLKSELAKTNSKVILVSSSIHSEGKTVTSTNLAVSLAEAENVKVALVDADLRRGKVATYMGISKTKPGLSNLLSESLTIKNVMVKTQAPNLFVIPRGPVPKNPSEQVHSNKMSLLVEELRESFDYVIIDAPPIMSVADAAILTRLVDGVIFVIQVGRTPKTVVAHSQQLFKQTGVRMFGCILTNVEFQSADYKYYSDYNYYGEGEVKEGIKQRSKMELRKAGWSIRNLEDRFNHWWERKVLKRNNEDEEV